MNRKQFKFHRGSMQTRAVVRCPLCFVIRSNSTVVRCKQNSITAGSITIAVQIPPWFDANSRGDRCIQHRHNVQIPPWFDANSRYLPRFSRVSTFEWLKNFRRSPVPLKSWGIDGTKQRLCFVLDHLDLVFPVDRWNKATALST